MSEAIKNLRKIPATPATKQAIFELMLRLSSQKNERGRPVGTWLVPSSDYRLQILDPGDENMGMEKLANIVLSSPPEQGQRITETYDLSKIPDGLNLDRRLGMYDRQVVRYGLLQERLLNEGVPEDSDSYVAMGVLVGAVREAATRVTPKTQQQEAELGMLGTSEFHALKLLTALASAIPYTPSKPAAS